MALLLKNTTRQIDLIDGDIGRSLAQITHNIMHPGLLDDIRETINQSVTIEREVQDRNGNWLLMRILPYITQDGMNEGAVILFINIHELKNLHLMQASILDSSPNGILALKAIRNNLGVVVDFVCTLANSQAETFLGVQEDALLQKPLSRTLPYLLDQGLFERYLRVINTGEVLELELEQPGEPDSGKLWFHLIGVKVDDGVVLTLQDITERKAYEEQLVRQREEIRANAERFRTLLEAVPHITFTSTPTGENNSVNQAWHTYTGLGEADSMGWGWTRALHPEDLDQIREDYEVSLRAGREHNTQARIRRHDGAYRWHLIKVVPIHNQEGEITLWIGTATDIQDQKDAEERSTRARLRRQREITETILQAQETERTRISEALHNGLGQVLYAARLKMDSLEAGEPRLMALKDQVLNLLQEAISKTRNISYELTPAILKDFGMKTALEELIRRVEGGTLDIECDVEGFEDRPEYFVELGLYRIIQELLNNIIKHAEATKAVIELTHKNARICLKVKDNGKGFNYEEATVRQGIGINSIQNRVKLLEGTLKVNSQPGRGTVITIIVKDSRKS